MVKVIDKINAAIAEGKPSFSFEYFPPRTDEGVVNLFERLDRMAVFGPVFCDITWGAGGSTADITMDIATRMQNVTCVETMMHLTCVNMTEQQLRDVLDKMKAAGITNILALRGDPPAGKEDFEPIEGGFSSALELVQFIRKEYGDYFGIGVAGYPESHPTQIVADPVENEKKYWEGLHYLKAKVDAGGELIMTQLFYDLDRFQKYVADCRSIGIKVPIIPGIMPILSYPRFKRMVSLCKVGVPDELMKQLESIKDDDEAVRAFGTAYVTDMCRKLLDAGKPGLHMYSMNLERGVLDILENLGIISRNKVARSLPWRQANAVSRKDESVRPIFWSNRPRSYMERTAEWDTYPSGRWGNSQSPAYGTLNDYQFLRKHTFTEERLTRARSFWGESPSSVEDIVAVFVKYVSGEIDRLPWNEMGNMHLETSEVQPQLVALNQQGILTINSQPKVNGAPSSDHKVGWGGPNGYVYQKAYVEFFISPQQFAQLEERLRENPLVTYMATNRAGDMHANVGPDDVNAVTWGVFPAKEVVQPTVVDPKSFMVWKDEAFQIWTTEWASLYEEGSPSRAVLEEVASTWFLVSVVDNDYIGGDLFKIFGL